MTIDAVEGRLLLAATLLTAAAYRDAITLELARLGRVEWERAGVNGTKLALALVRSMPTRGAADARSLWRGRYCRMCGASRSFSFTKEVHEDACARKFLALWPDSLTELLRRAEAGDDA